MKIFPFFFMGLLLVSCSQVQVKLPLPSERIVRFQTLDAQIGYGVTGERGVIFTATHVVDACEKWQCHIGTMPIGDFSIERKGELSIIGNTGANISIKPTEIRPGDKVYLLRFESGSLKHYDTHITVINAEYIGYDAALSGRYYTGALEIALALDPGESGLPVWTSSGELIGVVSASDRRAGKSYVVK